MVYCRLQAILSSYIHSPNGLLIKVANGENCPIYYLRKIYKCSKLDWCHPAPECEDTGPAPGLRWSHFTSRHRDSWPRDLAPASILHHRFFANPRSHAPRSGETNHKPPKFHKENFWALRPLLLFDKLSCSIYCKLQIANTKLLMKSGQPIKKFLSTNKQNEPT